MPLFRRDKRNDPAPAEGTQSDSYSGCLGYVGRQLDEQGCRSVAVAEVTGNYILRAVRKQNSESYISEVVPDDFKRGSVRLPSKLQASSYEAMFKAIGHDLDRRIAANIAIVERQTSFEVLGWERGETRGQLGYVIFNESYDRAALQQRAEQNR